MLDATRQLHLPLREGRSGLYALVGVICHRGRECERGGHFFTIGKWGQAWRKHDGSSVSDVTGLDFLKDEYGPEEEGSRAVILAYAALAHEKSSMASEQTVQGSTEATATPSPAPPTEFTFVGEEGEGSDRNSPQKRAREEEIQAKKGSEGEEKEEKEEEEKEEEEEEENPPGKAPAKRAKQARSEPDFDFEFEEEPPPGNSGEPAGGALSDSQVGAPPLISSPVKTPTTLVDIASPAGPREPTGG